MCFFFLVCCLLSSLFFCSSIKLSCHLSVVPSDCDVILELIVIGRSHIISNKKKEESLERGIYKEENFSYIIKPIQIKYGIPSFAPKPFPYFPNYIADSFFVDLDPRIKVVLPFLLITCIISISFYH